MNRNMKSLRCKWNIISGTAFNMYLPRTSNAFGRIVITSLPKWLALFLKEMTESTLFLHIFVEQH